MLVSGPQKTGQKLNENRLKKSLFHLRITKISKIFQLYLKSPILLFINTPLPIVHLCLASGHPRDLAGPRQALPPL